MLTRDKVMATILAGAIGDTLGMPVEGWSHEKIEKTYGRVSRLLDPKDHKNFSDMSAGWWTDDMTLKLAILKSLTEQGIRINEESMMKHQLAEYDANLRGFGPKTATARSIEQYRTEKKYSKGDKEAKGNGIAMKSAPFGLLMAILDQRFTGVTLDDQLRHLEFMIGIIARMSHDNQMAVASGIAQARAVRNCLAGRIAVSDFMSDLIGTAVYIEDSEDRILSTRLTNVRKNIGWFKLMPAEHIRERHHLFGNGGCYIPDSLPFTYALFLRNPYSIETLFDVVSAGGNTDTNGSMCGELLGALNGMKIFAGHEDLIEGLWRKDELIATANAFCDKFEIKE